MKLSRKQRHFAPRKRAWGNKSTPGHRSSGRGDRVLALDPFHVLGTIVPWLRRHLRTGKT